MESGDGPRSPAFGEGHKHDNGDGVPVSDENENEDGRSKLLNKNHGEVHKESREADTDGGVPIDRGWAWMAVLGCFGMHVVVVGGCKSLGVLIVEIRDRFQDVAAIQLGLVQGINATLMLGLGLFANMLSVRFTTRAVVFVGGLLSCAGFIMTAFIDKFYMVYLTYSITCGIGFGLSYTPCIVFVGSHFKQRRSLANGLSLSGSGVGSFLLPNLMRWTLNIYGLPGCCMLMGALVLHVCACALLFRPHSDYRSQRARKSQNAEAVQTETSKEGLLTHYKTNADRDVTQLMKENVVDDTSNHQLTSQNDRQLEKSKEDAINTSTIYHEGLVLDKVNTQVKSTSEDKNGLDSYPNNSNESEFIELRKQDCTSTDKCVSYENERAKTKPSSSSPRQRIFDWSLLSHPVFLLYLVFAFIVNFGYPNVFFMLPAHAENTGQNRDDSALLVSIVGLTDLAGRLAIGWFADLRLIKRRYIFVFLVLCSGILNLLIPAITSFWGLATYAFIYGFSAGGYVALIAVILSDAMGPEKLSSSFGLFMMSMSLSLIPGPLLCGQIRDSTGSWDSAFMFMGAAAVTASILPLCEPLARRCHNQRSNDTTDVQLVEMKADHTKETLA